MNFSKPRYWDDKFSFISLLLLPISFIIVVLAYLKKNITHKIKHKIKVICIGNLYVGGTGKTPLAIDLVKSLNKHSKKTTLIKKFYKNHIDEFNLIKSNKISYFSDKSRNAAILKAKKNKYNVMVLDDGFQDPSFYKDLSIICFNEKQLIGNGRVIPAGPLRESIQSIKNAKIIVINGKKNIKFERKILAISKSIKIYYSKYRPVNSKEFKSHNLIAFAGIGNPENFFSLLKESKFKVKQTISYPDHYKFSKNELLKIISTAKKNNLKIITTEKDYYRIKHLRLNDIKYLKTKLEIKNKNKLIKNILEYIK